MSKIKVYMDDGRVFEYEADQDGAREHASEILRGGYRRQVDGTTTFYPVHRIRKVKVTEDVVTTYPDTVSAT